MSTTKVINHLSVDNLNLNEVLSQQDKFFVNDDLILIFNGNVQRIPVFSKEEIYQMVEPRFILVLEGSAEVCINLQDYHIKKGNVMLIPADTIVEVDNISDDARVMAIVFRDSVEMSDEVVYKTSPAEFDRLLRMYYLLWDVVHLSPYRRKTVQYLSKAIVADVQELNELVSEKVQNEGSTRTQELFLQFKRLVKQHCMQERSIPYYASQLHVTPHHLSATIKKASGQSVMYWINRATIQEAKLLLKTNGMMAYEIANRMNFPSASAFSKFFKRETGLTPRAYQETTYR
ncbi:AraC family transcriptional regulator [Prevotella melaninogenica]|uniref:helix-turn-helix domain-containing protein n=1 Tax=Prevotella melaninogenica TaxID=28132 RepID=UPI001D15CF97|nr:helix-turn-helix transcriptional regulator [Prevotella melaninogenica]UEB01149.1 AraC family transcriptional regulator [Prevotella melaninogenica]